MQNCRQPAGGSHAVCTGRSSHHSEPEERVQRVVSQWTEAGHVFTSLDFKRVYFNIFNPFLQCLCLWFMSLFLM